MSAPGWDQGPSPLPTFAVVINASLLIPTGPSWLTPKSKLPPPPSPSSTLIVLKLAGSCQFQAELASGKQEVLALSPEPLSPSQCIINGRSQPPRGRSHVYSCSTIKDAGALRLEITGERQDDRCTRPTSGCWLPGHM